VLLLEAGSRVLARLGGGEAWLAGTLAAATEDAAASGSNRTWTVAFDAGITQDLPLAAVRPWIEDSGLRGWVVGESVECRAGRKWVAGTVASAHADGTADVGLLEAGAQEDGQPRPRKLFSVPPENLRRAGSRADAQPAAAAGGGGDAGGGDQWARELGEDRAARAAIAAVLTKSPWGRTFQTWVRYQDDAGAVLRGAEGSAANGRRRTVVVAGSVAAGEDASGAAKALEQLLAQHVTFGATSSSSGSRSSGGATLPCHFSVAVEVRAGDAAVAPRVKGGRFLGGGRTDESTR
jgi:hypothetical protein